MRITASGRGSVPEPGFNTHKIEVTERFRVYANNVVIPDHTPCTCYWFLFFKPPYLRPALVAAPCYFPSIPCQLANMVLYYILAADERANIDMVDTFEEWVPDSEPSSEESSSSN